MAEIARQADFWAKTPSAPYDPDEDSDLDPDEEPFDEPRYWAERLERLATYAETDGPTLEYLGRSVLDQLVAHDLNRERAYRLYQGGVGHPSFEQSKAAANFSLAYLCGLAKAGIAGRLAAKLPRGSELSTLRAHRGFD